MVIEEALPQSPSQSSLGSPSRIDGSMAKVYSEYGLVHVISAFLSTVNGSAEVATINEVREKMV